MSQDCSYQPRADWIDRPSAQISSAPLFFQFHVHPESYSLQHLVISKGQDGASANGEVAQEKSSLASNEPELRVRPYSRSFNYTISLHGLMTLP